MIGEDGFFDWFMIMGITKMVFLKMVRFNTKGNNIITKCIIIIKQLFKNDIRKYEEITKKDRIYKHVIQC